jgi:hypothetical protein
LGNPRILGQAEISFQGHSGQLLPDIRAEPNFDLDLQVRTLAEIIPPDSRPQIAGLPPLPPESHLDLNGRLTGRGSVLAGTLDWSTPLLTGKAEDLELERKTPDGPVRIKALLTASPGPLWDLPPQAYILDGEAVLEADRLDLTGLKLQGPGLSAGFRGSNSAGRQNLAAEITLLPLPGLRDLIAKITGPGQPWPEKLETALELERNPETEVLAAKGTVRLDELADILPDWAGELEAAWQVSGTLNDLAYSLTASSPQLSSPAGPISDIRAALEGRRQTPASPAPSRPASLLSAKFSLTAQPPARLKEASSDRTPPGTSGRSGRSGPNPAQPGPSLNNPNNPDNPDNPDSPDGRSPSLRTAVPEAPAPPRLQPAVSSGSAPIIYPAAASAGQAPSASQVSGASAETAASDLAESKPPAAGNAPPPAASGRNSESGSPDRTSGPAPAAASGRNSDGGPPAETSGPEAAGTSGSSSSGPAPSGSPAGAEPLKVKASVILEQGPGYLKAAVSELLAELPGIAAQSRELELTLAEEAPPQLKGGLTAEVSDWTFLSRLLELDLAGSPARAEIKLVQDPSPRAEAVIEAKSFRLGTAAALSQVRLEISSLLAQEGSLKLELTQGPGRLGGLDLTGGRIQLAGAGRWSEGLAGNLTVSLTGPKGDLASLEADYSLKDKTAVLKRLYLAPPQLNGPVNTVRPVRIAFADGIAWDNFEAAFSQGGHIQTSGRFGGSQPAEIALQTKALPLNIVSLLENPPQGKADLTVRYNQNTGGTVELDSSLQQPRVLSVKVSGRLSGPSLKGEAQVSWPRSPRPVKASFSLPMKTSGSLPVPDPGGPLEALVQWQGPAGQLWGLTGLEDMALKGEVNFKLHSTGTLSRPKNELALYLAQGSIQDPSSGLSLSGLNLSGHMDAQGEIQILAEGSDGGSGRLALEGALSPQANPPHLKARVQLNRLSPLRRDDLELTLSALATLEGPLDRLKLTAKAVIEKAEVSLAQGLGGPPVTTLDLGTAQTAASSPLDLDLTVEIPNQFYIRGIGLDSEWQGSLKLYGQASQPIISGNIKPVRGYLELLSKQFTITSGDIRFYDTTVINPSLNLELTRQASEILAIIRLSGTKNQPRLSLESQPARPADEVLAQILFGKNTSQLSRVETLQLANSLRALTGVSSVDLFAPLNTVRDTLGLSVLRFGETTAGGDNRILESNSFRNNLNLDNDDTPVESSATLEAGKYISDRIYVGVEQSLGDNSTGVRVEVELTPSLNLQSKTTTQSSRVGLGWKKDY